jgi:Glutaredoxin and related proteins
MESTIDKLPPDLTTLLTPGKLIIFAIRSCPYCERAKKLLKNKGVAYEYILCDKLGITRDQRNQFLEMTGAKTYPRIFIGSKSIGGYNELKELNSKGLLDKMLREENIAIYPKPKL